MSNRNLRRWLALGVLALLLVARQMGWVPESGGEPATPSGIPAHGGAETTPETTPAATSARVPASTGEIERLFADGRSDEMVEDEGRVIAVLPDDNHGSRHQRLIVELASGHTVLIAHNIDLAPRIRDVRKGDRLRFRGEFEWNDRGGVIHWTHHDPAGRHPGGWLRHDGETYE